MSKRLRIAAVTVQVALVWDDGDDIEPGPPTQPQQVSIKDLPTEQTLKEQVAALESQLLVAELDEPVAVP